MKNIFLLLVCLLISFSSFAKKIDLSANKVIYKTLDDLSGNIRRQAVLILSSARKYKDRKVYLLEFKSKPYYKYQTIYEPYADTITTKKFSYSELINTDIYVGKAAQRLELLKSKLASYFSLSDDVVSDVDGIILHETPEKNKERLQEEEEEKKRQEKE